GSWIVDRGRLSAESRAAHRSHPRTPKAFWPRVEISLGGTTDPFNPCGYPLNPYPKVLGTSRAALLVASRSNAPRRLGTQLNADVANERELARRAPSTVATARRLATT